MTKKLTLNDLQIGHKTTISHLNIQGEMRRRLLDIGLIENTEIECIGKSPMGDPRAYLIRGAVIAIRSKDSENIFIN